MDLLEYKNISDKVYNLSLKIYNEIIDDSDAQPKKKSRYNKTLFIENTIDINTDDCFTNISQIKVNYILYLTDSLQDYNRTMDFIGSDANSESDYQSKTVKIVSGFIGDYPAPDFLSTICHEINHLFEYDNGREKRVDLYDKTVGLLSKRGNDNNAFAVGSALYYTFPHERDAFIHQFYGFLIQEEPLQYDFDQLLNFSPYKQAKMATDNIIANKNNPNIMKWINYLGFGRKDFINRLETNLKKMKKKMYNAYISFKEDYAPIGEGHIHRMLQEETDRFKSEKHYQDKIEWGIESIYIF